MNKFFKKFSNYGFWVALSGAVIMFLDALGRAFGFAVENKVIEDVILSFAGVLVVFGVVTNSKATKNDDEKWNGFKAKIHIKYLNN